MGQDSLQDPCLRDPRKIKTSESHYFVPDPCFRISTGSMTPGPLQNPCLRILREMHVSGSMSAYRHLRVVYIPKEPNSIVLIVLFL